MTPSPQTPSGRRAWHRGLAAALLVTPLLGALLLRPSAATSSLAGLVLLAEPLTIGLACYLLLVLLARRWWLSALSLTIGTSTAVALLHAPGTPSTLPAVEIPWAQSAAECLVGGEEGASDLRVLSWNAQGATLDDETLRILVEQRPDLAVLTSLDDGRFLERLTELLPGESLSFGSRGDQVGLFVRGDFIDCGEEAGAWPLTVFAPGHGPILADYALDHADQEQLPDHHAARRTSAQLVFAYPRIQGVGVVPVVAYQLPTDSSRLGSNTWAAAVREGSQALAITATLGGPSVVAVGHLGAPPTFQQALADLRGAGLHDAGGPPTWPATLHGLPFLPLYRMERVLSGSAWQARSSETIELPGPHQPLLVLLERVEEPGPVPFGDGR